MELIGRPLPILLQGISVIAAMALWPPASGRMLMVPVRAESGPVVKAALAGGAMLIGLGPVRGSVIVMGNRSRIMDAISSWDIIVTAAPPAGCGDVGSPDAAA